MNAGHAERQDDRYAEYEAKGSRDMESRRNFVVFEVVVFVGNALVIANHEALAAVHKLSKSILRMLDGEQSLPRMIDNR